MEKDWEYETAFLNSSNGRPEDHWINCESKSIRVLIVQESPRTKRLSDCAALLKA